jgi:hypothetical protein
MKSILAVIAACLLLTGCPSRGPVKTSFPMPSSALMQPPRELKTLAPATAEPKLLEFGDGTPSGIPLSTVVKIVIENYNNCNLNKEQLLLLQEWVNEQKKANP